MSEYYPQFTAIEIRVLGTLIEKSRITPDYYPMTLNALTAACNQKTARWPVTDYSEEDVQAALQTLKGYSLAATAVGAGSRVVKYKHNFLTVHLVSDAELAVLCLLFLRGPQTPGELNTNAGRLYEFASSASVHELLINMLSAEHPMVVELSKQAGQKETRFAHLFSPVGETAMVSESPMETASQVTLTTRVEQLEARVAELTEQLQRITKELF
jgi:uncharacterized protein YceH (UPF0502 family)